ncbi:MAG TPA: histidine kinase [Telluria sp.]|jgi:LytS/YehU family sensor histidine kinase
MDDQPETMTHHRWSGLGWVLLAGCALSLQSTLGYLLFAEGPLRFGAAHAILLLFHLVLGTLALACNRLLNPILAHRYPQALAPRMVFGQLAVLACTLAAIITVYLQLFPLVMGRDVRATGLSQVALRAGIVAMFIYGWLQMHAFSAEQSSRAALVLRETTAMETDLDRSELAMLEAQIEPHFLFNTLAHVKRMYRIDDEAAGDVLARLIDYLQRALPALRTPGWRVADELDLIGLYLNLIEQRFGGRMRYTITLAPDAADVLLPALTIATLVDNAVRHGVTPKAGAGLIEVSVSLRDSELIIAVRDDGVGLRQTSGSGLGLATVHARLRARFGNAARLLVEPLAQGVHSSIRIAMTGQHA